MNNITIDEKIRKIRCILFDVDGTLAHAHPTFISQESADILNALQDKGYLVGFSTGRALTSLSFLMRPVGLRTNTHSIGCAGAEIGPAGGLPGNAVYNRFFPTDTLLDMLSVVLDNGLQFSCDADGTLYTSEHLDYAETYMTNYRLAQELGGFFPKPTPLTRETLPRVLDGTVMKPMIWFRTEEEFHLMDPWFRNHPDYHYQSSGFNLMEVQPNDVSKAVALHRLAEMLDLTAENFCVFGDSENDMPILQAAGLSVAMANAYDVAKETSDLITPIDNMNSGAARFAAELFL